MKKKSNSTYIEDVHELAKLVPAGRVTTYGAIADALALGSARMAGWAMNQAFSRNDVPAHRVVNRKGELTGRLHFRTPTLMQEMLEAEGITVKNHRVQDFDKLFWNPSEEI